MKKGLVLEGGALRGLFSAGVMDVLMEQKIEFDGVVGVSAGACFGCNIISRQPGRVIRYNKKLAHDWRYASLRSWFLTGDYFGGEFDYHYMPEYIDVFDVKTFQENKTEFWIVCTDVETGEPVYQKIGKVDYESLEYIRASASMPLASKIVNINNRKFLDGGVADSIPLRFFQQKGFQQNVVVLTQPEGFIKQKNKLMPLMKIVLHKYPRFIDAMARRHEMYNFELDYLAVEEKKGNILVMRPANKLAIGHISHDPEEMQITYELGRRVAENRLDDIISFMV